MVGRAPPHDNGYPPASDLAARLAQCRADWLPRYFPAGKLRAGVFELGSADGDAGRSLPIPLRATKAGLVDFAGGFRGDDLDLLTRAIGGDSKAAYKEAALTFLGIAGKVTAPRRAPPPQSCPTPPKSDNRELAQRIWRETTRIRDRLGLDYLVCRRGITEWDEDRVRWHPECPWDGDRVGCIVCPIVSHITSYTVGIWRIRPVMAGKVKRMGLGPTKGNFSPIWWTDGDELALTEGVEDALAFHQLTGIPAWSTLAATFMAEVILPERFRRILIVQDNDPTNDLGHRPGPEAAQKLARRLRGEGRQARILASVFGKDPNDALLRETVP